MQYCLLMHYREGTEIGLTEEDMAPARAAFARYADDLDAAGVLIGTQELQSAVVSPTFTARNGDIAAAEDAIADALERALTRWPVDGIPINPEAWVLTVARNRLRDHWKSSAYRMTDPLPE